MPTGRGTASFLHIKPRVTGSLRLATTDAIARDEAKRTELEAVFSRLLANLKSWS